MPLRRSLDHESNTLWARDERGAENAVLDAGFARAPIFRPGAIVAKRGIKHSVRLYGRSSLLAPLMRLFDMATSTVEIGRAMIAAVLGKRVGEPGQVRFESAGINTLAMACPLVVDRDL